MARAVMPVTLRWLAGQHLPVLVACAAVAIASPTRAPAKDPAFRIEISVVAGSVQCTRAAGCGFMAHTVVQNNSANAVAITVWTQSGWSWVSDSAGIVPDISAAKNIPTTIHLKPGERYPSTVRLWCSMQATPPTFRLGFVPDAERPASGIPGIETSKDVAWSHPIDIPHACRVDRTGRRSAHQQ